MTDNQLAGYFSYLDKLNRMAITNMRRASDPDLSECMVS